MESLCMDSLFHWGQISFLSFDIFEGFVEIFGDVNKRAYANQRHVMH